MRGRGGAFAAALMWTLIGAGAGVALAGIATIGVFVAPVVALFAWMQIRQRGIEQVSWSALGAGVVLSAVGIASLPYQACGSSGTSTISVGTVGESASFECGGLHPAVPIALGVALIVGGLISAYTRR